MNVFKSKSKVLEYPAADVGSCVSQKLIRGEFVVTHHPLCSDAGFK